MSFTSIAYLLFTAGCAMIYYLIPGCASRYQYFVLLIFSYVFYLLNGPALIFFLLFTTFSTFFAARLLDRLEDRMKQLGRGAENKARRQEIRKKKKAIFILCLVLNFGVLFFLKYLDVWTWALPLGISFYTFQSMGYLIDVYWGRTCAEQHPTRFMLFVSFFPQILQGPIGRYERLMPQLAGETEVDGKMVCTGHRLDLVQVEHGAQRMLWGYFLKFVIADRAGAAVSLVNSNYLEYSGTYYAVTALLYAAQLYGDFAGGMDVVIGTAEIFGIHLDENFKRPYFSCSITDFWHRWHITLGTWMKDYVFYPMTVSSWMRKLTKGAKKHIGRKGAAILQATIANILVFLLVGIWHGKGGKYLVYGLYNGVIISLEALLGTAHPSKNRVLHLLQVLVTFILVTISWFWDFPTTLSQSNYMLTHAFTDFHLNEITGQIFVDLHFTPGILAFGCLVLLVKSLLEEIRQKSIFEQMDALPRSARWAIYYGVMFSVLIFQSNGLASGFIYAQF